jgi:hypothetical protein
MYSLNHPPVTEVTPETETTVTRVRARYALIQTKCHECHYPGFHTGKMGRPSLSSPFSMADRP